MTWHPVDLVRVATGELGVHETDAQGRTAHTNDGTRIRVYQAVTRAFRAAWCVSFVQWCLAQVGAGPVANRTAGVFYFADYARKHGWTVKIPQPADVFCLMTGQGHMGLVVAFNPKTQRFSTVEGNHGDAVKPDERHLPGPYVFVRVPGEAKTKRFLLVPRFEIVTGAGQHPRVLVPWGKWSVVGPKVPRAVADHQAARVLRKVVKAAAA